MTYFMPNWPCMYGTLRGIHALLLISPIIVMPCHISSMWHNRTTCDGNHDTTTNNNNNEDNESPFTTPLYREVEARSIFRMLIPSSPLYAWAFNSRGSIFYYKTSTRQVIMVCGGGQFVKARSFIILGLDNKSLVSIYTITKQQFEPIHWVTLCIVRSWHFFMGLMMWNAYDEFSVHLDEFVVYILWCLVDVSWAERYAKP